MNNMTRLSTVVLLPDIFVLKFDLSSGDNTLVGVLDYQSSALETKDTGHCYRNIFRSEKTMVISHIFTSMGVRCTPGVPLADNRRKRFIAEESECQFLRSARDL